MKLAIIEDHNIIKETLQTYFNGQDNFECSLTSPSVEQFYKDFVKHEHPDILLLDIQLPGQHGHLAIPQLKHLLRNTKIIIFSIYEDEKSIVQALKNGADGYIHKSASLEEIKATLEGHSASLSPNVADTLINHLKGSSNQKTSLQELSARELDVLKLLSDGFTQKQIGNRLFISIDTVRYHCKNLYAKLNVNSNIEAVKIYLQET
ncbi:MAG: response regulator [Flavobacteriaceae bacterium]